jgi:hypothetical protein
MQGYTCKGGSARKVTERKICNTHLLEAWEVIFKCDEKGRKRARRARKVTERKMGNMHLLEAGKANFKGCGKKGGKRIESDGKKGGKRVKRVRK